MRAHAEPQRTYLPVDNDILVDLLSDLLPARPADAAGVSNFVQAGHNHGTIQRGRVVPAQDHVIAASALSIGAALLTTDAHLHEFPGLTVYDPPA